MVFCTTDSQLGSFGFAIAALALITLDLKKGIKIKNFLFKVI